MNPQQTYWLEELKQNDKKLEKLDTIALELIKFYFLTLFSLTTIVFTLYNYKIINTEKSWFFLVFLFPFILGLVVSITLKKIVSQYTTVETSRNQISEWFISGEIKNKFTLTGTTFSAFYTLLTLLVSANFIICIYFAFPFLQKYFKLPPIITIFVAAILISVVVIGIIGIFSAIVLASLGSARKTARDASRKANISNLKVILELYYNDNNNYPITNDFNDLLIKLTKYLSTPISDPLSKEGWSYEYQSKNGKDYTLKAKLEKGGEFVVNSRDTK